MEEVGRLHNKRNEKNRLLSPVTLFCNGDYCSTSYGSCYHLPRPITGRVYSDLRDIVQEVCESRGGRPGLSVLTSLLVSVDVKIYCTVLRHWSQLVPNMSTDI